MKNSSIVSRTGAALSNLLGMLLLCLFSPHFANAAGVTIITHGYGGDVTGWIAAMANEIPVYYHSLHPGVSATNLTIYTLSLTYSNSPGHYYYLWQLDSGDSPTNSNTGEIIVKLDWSQMAGLSAPYDISTYDVAWVASQALLRANSALGGRPWVEFPLHLIGHSRGGSLMSELSYLLGTNGVWVDHLTTLDPHPFNNDGNIDIGFPNRRTCQEHICQRPVCR